MRAIPGTARVVAAVGVLVGTWASCGSAQPAGVSAAGRVQDAGRVKDVASLLGPIREQDKVPALAGAIVTLDGLEALGALGVRASGHEEKVQPSDRFHLGSCTKAMTATLIGILVEQGKLSWDLKLGEAFPELTGMSEKYRDVTLAELLTQRSGVPADLQRDGVWNRMWRGEGSLVDQRRLVTKAVLGWGPDHDKSTWVYSNTNYIIAGHIAETVTGRPWEELMKSLVFGPLGMTSAGFGAPGAEGAIDQPQGHRADGTAVGVGPGADNPPALGPAGTVHASLEDWGKFISFHLRGSKAAREGGEVKVGEVTVHSATFKKLQTAVSGGGVDYAMGWGTAHRPWAKGPGGDDWVYTHSGSNTMWFCTVWVAPEAGFAVLSATNSGGPTASRACDDAAGALIKQHQADGGK